MIDKALFGERFRAARKKKGETQSVIAEILDVTVTQISDLENGNTLTNMDRLSLICKHYGISADYLMGLTDDPTPHGRK